MKKDIFVFDLGGVLIDWNPKDYYLKFVTEKEYLDFIKFITPYNSLGDIGVAARLMRDGLMTIYPQKEKLIKIWFDEWDEFLKNPIKDTVDILQGLYDKGYPLYSITNWSRENFPQFINEYSFLNLFIDIVVSGYVGLIKPGKDIFNLLLKRNKLSAKDCIFIDDSLPNVNTAISLGFRAFQFQNPKKLKEDLAFIKIEF